MPQTNRPFLFAITGGIATGKTLFTGMLRDLGLSILDTDHIGHDVLDNEVVRDILVIRWGDQILELSKINREKIASIVFNDQQELKFLNQLVHPMILREMERNISLCMNPILGYEIPLLFETGLQKCFDINILVTSSNENRLQRLTEHRMDRVEALKRMNAQMSETKKAELADVVVYNDGDMNTLENEATRVFDLIQQYKKIEVFSFEDFIKANVSAMNS